mmetsp:Transcript_13205/g.25554  ORF Transcript_13205/g.25554 Transcript_13205/m.25554 type:complete len:628 (-) Transcript_13205:1537-3420(-)
MRNVCGLVVNGVRVHGSGLNRCRGGVRLLRRVDLIIIKELIRLGIVSVDSAELEATANRFLNLHNEEVHKHEKNGESPADAVLRLHTEDNVVEARNVGEANLENNNNSDRVPGILVATEDTRVEGGVVSEASGKHNRNSTESEGIGSLGAKLSNRLLKAVSSLVKDGFGTSFSKLTVVNEVVASTATHDKDRTNGSGDECDSANDNSEEEEATDETLANTTGREAHDAILRHFNSKNETEGDSTDQVTVENLDRGERTELKTTDNTKEDSHTLGVVDGGVKEKDLTEVIPHGTTLLDGTHNSSKVIISKNHLSSLTSDISTLLTHSNTHVGGLESRGIVDTITSHGRHLALGLKSLDNANLVLRGSTSKDIVGKHSLTEFLIRLGIELRTSDSIRVVLVNNSELITDSKSGSTVVTSDHLDGYTCTMGLLDSRDTLGTGRIYDSANTNNGKPRLITGDELRAKLLTGLRGISRNNSAAKGKATETMGREIVGSVKPVVAINRLRLSNITVLSLVGSHSNQAIRGTLDVNNNTVGDLVNLRNGVAEGGHKLVLRGERDLVNDGLVLAHFDVVNIGKVSSTDNSNLSGVTDLTIAATIGTEHGVGADNTTGKNTAKKLVRRGLAVGNGH